MNFLKYFFICVLAFFYIVILYLALRSKKVFSCLFLNALISFTVLAIICFTKKYTGFYLPINKYTVIGSGTFGIPAIIGFLVLNLIF